MRTRLALILAAALLGLSGCAQPWPDEGRGGMAERLPPDDADMAQAQTALALLAENPGGTGSGKVSLARERFIRARREAEAQLPRDAEKTLREIIVLTGGLERPVMKSCFRAPC